jgi:hypothetical protein
MHNTAHQSFEAVAIAASNKVTAVGGATAGAAAIAVKTGFLGVSVTDICALAGVAIAFSGFAVSFYFQWRRDSRESREHRARINRNG